MEVGNHLKDRFQPGEKFVLQPAMGLPSGYSAGYSYEYFGGMPPTALFRKSPLIWGVYSLPRKLLCECILSEPMSCIIGAYHATYHTKQYVYEHFMGVKEQESWRLWAVPDRWESERLIMQWMGSVSSKLIVVTDIDEQRLERARTLIPEEAAKKQGKTLIYINTKDIDAVSELRKLSRAPALMMCLYLPQYQHFWSRLTQYWEMMDVWTSLQDQPINNLQYRLISTMCIMKERILWEPLADQRRICWNALRCLQKTDWIKLYDYTYRWVAGCTGNNSESAKYTGREKLIYPHIDLPLTAIENFRSRQSENPLFKTLADICERNHNVWCEEAETYLLEYYQV